MQAPVVPDLDSSLEATPGPHLAGWDETRDADGRARPQWRKLLELLDGLGPPEIARRWDKAQHLIHENGVSYNVYGDPQGLERPWSLSPVPVVISSEEWLALSRGLAQRAAVLSAVLADLYGPQRMLLEGRIPPEIVFSHPSFLRAVRGSTVPRDCWLPVYAADLVRAPDGAWYAIEDRTQAPTGAGYALENRIVISSVLPDVFRECNVERLAGFFRVLRETLQWLAPHNRDNPRVVLLTSGPSNASYFEQAYLAQYLGFTLVSGGDLTVREDRVFLKTLGGLQPVDVILRRVNDDFCDPLELRPDSLLGVPGLVQAARMGNVAIANPLGTGLLHTPAILPYLGDLCQALLGEELVLPSAKTWWCGDASALAEVLGHFDNLVVKPAFPIGPNQPTFTSSLSSAERDDLIAKIRARPSRWVAQEYVTPSSAPTLSDGALVPRALVLRTYAIATRTNDYMVMPGGLARVAGSDQVSAVSMQLGARSEDLWVISSEHVTPLSLLPPSDLALTLSRGGGDLPSRAADNLYWLGRYAERAESVARLARVLGTRLVDAASEADLSKSSEIGPLLAALKAQTEFLYAVDIPRDPVVDLPTCEAELVSAVCDPKRQGSLAAGVRSTLRAGRIVRDRISMDTWRALATLDDEIAAFERIKGHDRVSALVHLLNQMVLTLAAFSGLAIDSMSRGQAWHFLDMGRRLERGVSLVTLLRATTTSRVEPEGPTLEAVLAIADSGMTYRRRYLATLQTAPVVDLLLTDETNPRSVIYQVRSLSEHMRALPELPGAPVQGPQKRLTLAAQSELELAEVDLLCAADETGHRPALEGMLRKLGSLLPALSDSISDSYLSHATVSRHLSHELRDMPPTSGGAEP